MADRRAYGRQRGHSRSPHPRLSNAAAQQLCWFRDLSLCAGLHTHMGMCRRNDCRQPRAKIARLADRTVRLDCRVLRAFRLLTPSVERPRAARRWWWQLPPGEHQGPPPFRSRSIIDRTELHGKFSQADALTRDGAALAVRPAPLPSILLPPPHPALRQRVRAAGRRQRLRLKGVRQ
jgi:hypothetical protein